MALRRQFEFLLGQKSTDLLPSVWYYSRLKPAITFARKKALSSTALCRPAPLRAWTSHYHEYIDAPKAGYVDLYGHVLQYTPDWACRIDGTLCTVELERSSHREDLYGALRDGNAKPTAAFAGNSCKPPCASA
jgi:hypothetical protein